MGEEDSPSEFVAAPEPVSVPAKTAGRTDAASGMRRSDASMVALSSLNVSGNDEQASGPPLSPMRLQSSGPSDDVGSCSPSSSIGELYCLGSDDESPQKSQTNMTRRTSSGTDIHY